jgi:hypothetical protein
LRNDSFPATQNICSGVRIIEREPVYKSDPAKSYSSGQNQQNIREPFAKALKQMHIPNIIVNTSALAKEKKAAGLLTSSP